MSWKVTIAVLCNGEPYLKVAFDRSPITVGAKPQNDVLLSDPFVSGEHAEVMVSGGQLVFRDQSTNGSFCAGERIEEKNLGLQGRIEIPPFELELTLVVDSAEWKTAFRQDISSSISTQPIAAPPQAPTVEIPCRPVPGDFTRPPPIDRPEARFPPPANLAAVPETGATTVVPSVIAAESFHLRVTDGPPNLRDQIFELPERQAILGRQESADLQLSDDTISRSHASLEPARDSVVLRDLGSSNGCVVDGQRVSEAHLQHGDKFQLGKVVLQLFRGGTGALLQPEATPSESLRTTPARATASVAMLEVEARLAEGNASIVLIDVRGRVDGYNYTQLADAVDAAIEDGGRYLVVDLSRVDFMSHTGLGIFVKSLARLRRLHGDLCLVGLNQRLHDAISLAHLDSMFHKRLAENREQALEAWRSRS